MKIQRVVTGYFPRPLQEHLHLVKARFKVIVCHRRFGKTVWAINETLDQALRNKKRNPQYAYIAPTYGQAKRVAWELLKDATKNIPGVETNEAELRVDIPRPASSDKIRIMLLGAENPGSVRGIYLDGCILDEFAECDPIIWSQVIRPALSDRLGWAIFIGTPKGRNHFYDVLEAAKRDPVNWYWVIYKASETKLIAQEELDAARSMMSEEEYEQEFECSFTAALIGAYYGKLMEEARKSGRVTKVPYDPILGVTTAWDLGVGDTTSIWFLQQTARERRLIDYYEMSGMGLDHYAKILKEKPYSYDEHILPFDAQARSLETGVSRVETLRSHGITRQRVLDKFGIDDGINAARLLLPMCWFDEQKCERGISALENYEKKWDAKNKIFSDSPKHNWASNGADAFRYLALGFRDEGRRPDHATLPRQSASDYDVLSN